MNLKITLIAMNTYLYLTILYFSRSIDFCQNNEEAQPLVGQALSVVGWIILAIIMTILCISICLLALVRYGMSHRRKKQKDAEIEEDVRVMSSASEYF